MQWMQWRMVPITTVLALFVVAGCRSDRAPDVRGTDAPDATDATDTAEIVDATAPDMYADVLTCDTVALASEAATTGSGDTSLRIGNHVLVIPGSSQNANRQVTFQQLEGDSLAYRIVQEGSPPPFAPPAQLTIDLAARCTQYDAGLWDIWRNAGDGSAQRHIRLPSRPAITVLVVGGSYFIVAD
jgi:hypothetical protein